MLPAPAVPAAGDVRGVAVRCRFGRDVVRYNRVAEAVMAELGVPVIVSLAPPACPAVQCAGPRVYDRRPGACENRLFLGEFQAPFPSAVAHSPLLKCSCRSDRVTRD